jgi:hypothetical protein
VEQLALFYIDKFDDESFSAGPKKNAASMEQSDLY